MDHIKVIESFIPYWLPRQKAAKQTLQEAKEQVTDAHQEVEASRAAGDDVALASAEARLASAYEAERKAAHVVNIIAYSMQSLEDTASHHLQRIMLIEVQQEALPGRWCPRRG